MLPLPPITRSTGRRPTIEVPAREDDLWAIGKALSLIYGDLPDKPLPRSLQVAVDRLSRALAARS